MLGPDGRTRGRVVLMANTGAEEMFTTLRVTDQGHLYHMVADDLGYGDLGSYGHPEIRTPNIDRLAIGAAVGETGDR